MHPRVIIGSFDPFIGMLHIQADSQHLFLLFLAVYTELLDFNSIRYFKYTQTKIWVFICQNWQKKLRTSPGNIRQIQGTMTHERSGEQSIHRPTVNFSMNIPLL